MRAITLAAILFAMASAPADAFCYEPLAPGCVSRYGRFDDDWQFQQCRREIEDFRSQTNEFQECQLREARQKIQTALDAYNQAVEDFNRRARSQ